MNKELLSAIVSAAMEPERTRREDVPFEIGKAYFIRGVTYHLVGRVQSIIGNFVQMDDVSWVAVSGRFANALKTGVLEEVEPMPNGSGISMLAICDYAPWHHELPTRQK